MQRQPMLILFDHGTPRSIARWLHGHTVVEAITMRMGQFSQRCIAERG
jgi:hypothetical protein